MERDAAFRQAGIDPSDPKQSYFVKGYDGELKAEDIKRAATEAGFLESPAPSPEQEYAMDAAQRIAAASAGAPPLVAASEQAMRSEMENALQTGGTEAVLAIARKYGAYPADDFR
jgi:hypothetical protein